MSSLAADYAALETLGNEEYSDGITVREAAAAVYGRDEYTATRWCEANGCQSYSDAVWHAAASLYPRHGDDPVRTVLVRREAVRLFFGEEA